MQKEKKYVLVISGGGAKGVYACGVLQSLEERGLKNQIKSIYGVSAGALAGAYRTSGRKAKDIFLRLLESDLFSIKNIAIPPTKSLLKSQAVKKILVSDVKERFDQLSIPLVVGTTDLLTGKHLLFDKGNLLEPLLGSMALPGIFQPVTYKNALLVDGGVTNNFPVNYAKKRYPQSKIIGILLSKFKKQQQVKNVFDTILISYDILLKGHLDKYLKQADILLYRELSVGTIENDEKKLTELFELGYQDGLKKFTP